jgi:hypothetical protein
MALFEVEGHLIDTESHAFRRLLISRYTGSTGAVHGARKAASQAADRMRGLMKFDTLDGIWRLVDIRACIESTQRLTSPLGGNPMGTIVFSNRRMLAAVCDGDRNAAEAGERSFHSYGGLYTFDGSTLEVVVDIASDPKWIGSNQVRAVVLLTEQEMLLRPPTRHYGDSLETRELIWERVWPPDAAK